MSQTALIDRYTAGPQMVRQAVVGMSDEQIRARPLTGKWSTLEVVCHLADFEVIGVDRLTAVIAEDEPMKCPWLDHYGLSVKSLDDLEAAHARAEAFRATDDRVDLIAPTVEDHEVVKIHSFYAGYLLPMMCELQFWEFSDGLGR